MKHPNPKKIKKVKAWMVLGYAGIPIFVGNNREHQENEKNPDCSCNPDTWQYKICFSKKGGQKEIEKLGGLLKLIPITISYAQTK